MGEWDSDSCSTALTEEGEMTRRSTHDSSFDGRWAMQSDGMNFKPPEFIGGRRGQFISKKLLGGRKPHSLSPPSSIYSHNSLKCSEIFEQIYSMVRKQTKNTVNT